MMRFQIDKDVFQDALNQVQHVLSTRTTLPILSNVLIEAAHLIPSAVSRNDHPSNGIALCRNHHWAMDRHLIAPCPSDKHAAGIWRVSPTLDSRISDLRELVGFDGEKVIPPEKEAPCYYPSTAALQWRADHLLQAG